MDGITKGSMGVYNRYYGRNEFKDDPNPSNRVEIKEDRSEKMKNQRIKRKVQQSPLSEPKKLFAEGSPPTEAITQEGVIFKRTDLPTIDSNSVEKHMEKMRRMKDRLREYKVTAHYDNMNPNYSKESLSPSRNSP